MSARKSLLLEVCCCVVALFTCARFASAKRLPENGTPKWYAADVGNAIADREIEISLDQLDPDSREFTFVADGRDPWRAIVSKCCNLGEGYTFENKSTCVRTENEFLPDFEDRPNYSENVKILPAKARYEYYIGDPCTDGKYVLDVATYSYDKYEIFSNGTLLYLEEIYTKEEFCMETLNATIRVFICFDSGKYAYDRDFKYVLYAVGLLISVPFLVATAVIYLSVDMLRDLRGKSLSCHAICLATGYVFLALVQLASEELNEEVCIAAGFTIQFFFVAAFFWLNVISFDTWRSIRKDFRSENKELNSGSEKIIFIYYFIYGFYGPVVISIISLIMDLEPAIPESYLKPRFGFQSCWFYSDEAALPYFFAPMGITISINLVFFILSIRMIYIAQKKKTRISNQDANPDDTITVKSLSIKIYRKTLQETVYLFCLMGINWTAEFISWAIGGSDLIWLVTDMFNTLQGVTIFYLFVLRPQNVRSHVTRQLHKFWRKMVTCDCGHKEETKPVTRIRQLNGHETVETCFTTENNESAGTPVSI